MIFHITPKIHSLVDSRLSYSTLINSPSNTLFFAPEKKHHELSRCKDHCTTDRQSKRSPGDLSAAVNCARGPAQGHGGWFHGAVSGGAQWVAVKNGGMGRLDGVTKVYVGLYMVHELQPNIGVMESSIRDIFIFLKLSWGLENDNTLFKKR